MSVVSQTAGPISRELKHDSDLCRLVADGCDSKRKGKGGEWGKEVKRERERKGEGVIDGMPFPPPTKGSRDEQLAIHVWQHCSNTLCTRMHTQTQLKIAKQRPSATSANYLAESRPGSRIRVVPAVGLDWRMALIVKRKRRERKAGCEKLSIRNKRILQRATWLPLRQPYRSVINT